MNDKYKKIFVITLFCLLWIPSTYFLGIKDPTVIRGAENITDLPSIQEKSFYERKFQPLFEGWWNSHFGFRRAMLKTKNQIYDWANFGMIHSGYEERIISNKNYLFERWYFDPYQKQCMKLPENVEKIKELNKIAKKNKIDLFVVLAPNKSVTYSELIPKRYKFFLGDYCDYYGKIEKELTDNDVKVFNAQKLALQIKENEKHQPFPLEGVHWNHYGAGRTVQETAKKFGWGAVKIIDLEHSNRSYSTEMDLVFLLNLIHHPKPKELFYRPVYGNLTPLHGETTIVGNSFSNEFATNFVKSGLAKSVHHFENPPFKPTDILDIRKSKRIILVYTDIAIMSRDPWISKKLDFMINGLGHIIRHQFTNAILPYNLTAKGLSKIESWGRWGEGNVIEFTLSDLPNKDLTVKFKTRAFLNAKRNFQNIDVFVNGKKFAKWNYKLGQPLPNTILIIPASIIQNNVLKIELRIEKPVSPKEIGFNNDHRKLSIGFEELKVE